jgi:hypothetical protein
MSGANGASDAANSGGAAGGNSGAANSGPANSGGAAPPTDDLRALIAASVAEDKKAAATPPAQANSEGGGEGEAGEKGQAGGDRGEGAPRRQTEKSEDRGAGDKPGEGAPGEPTTPPAPEDDAAKRAAAGARPGGTAEAPAHWSDADKAQFNALPEPARGPFLDLYKRMESGFTPKLQRGAQLERDYGELDRLVFTPEQRQIVAARRLTPVQLINSWADVERGLGGQNAVLKNQIVARIIHGYGVDPAAVAEILHQLRGFAPAAGGDQAWMSGAGGNGAAPPAANQTGVDPVLQQRLQALENRTQQAEAERIAAAQRAAGEQIQNFANEKDGEGQLTHPFFAELEAEMTSLAHFERSQGRTPVLQDLYDRALWANPSTREKQLALQQQAEAKRAAEERRAKAEQARRAGSSVTGAPSPGQAASTPADMSLRDTIKANMAGSVRQTSGGPGRI